MNKEKIKLEIYRHCLNGETVMSVCEIPANLDRILIDPERDNPCWGFAGTSQTESTVIAQEVIYLTGDVK